MASELPWHGGDFISGGSLKSRRWRRPAGSPLAGYGGKLGCKLHSGFSLIVALLVCAD